MVGDVEQGCEAAVMEKSALGVGPETVERGGAVAVVGSAIGFELVDADVAALVEIPSGLAEDGFGVTTAALGAS